MKNQIIRAGVMAALVISLLSSCKKEDTVAPSTGVTTANLQGTWIVATAEGTEWKEGAGIITPRAVSTDFIGMKFVFSSTTVTVKDVSNAVIFGPTSFTLNEANKTIDIGNGNTGLGFYSIPNFVAGATMSWDQREPLTEDYGANAGCGCNLAFQKFFTFTKQP